MSQSAVSQLGGEAIAAPALKTHHEVAPSLHHLEPDSQTAATQLGSLAIAPPSATVDGESDLDYHDLPPFPSDIPIAPLLRVKLGKLLNGDEAEIDRLWKACCELGFFYLDLRDHGTGTTATVGSPEHEELTKNVWHDHDRGDSPVEGNQSTAVHSNDHGEQTDGEQLLKDAMALFGAGKKLFELPLEEKLKYDWAAEGSYFGYKGYGSGTTDAKGTRDRNEFYNVSKDDILGISDPLPAPDVLHAHRSLLESFIKQSHSVVSLILGLLNSRLGLPSGTISAIHRLGAVSGDQVRWVNAPPQPSDDRKTALGQHTDFGSVTVLFNRLGGLQVLPPQSKEWLYVKPLKGHAIVNLGDAMVKLAAGILRSNIHRVISPPGEQADSTRMSLVYFARPEDDVLLKPLEGSDMIDKRKQQTGQSEEKSVETAKAWILRRALGRRADGNFNDSGGTDTERLGQ